MPGLPACRREHPSARARATVVQQGVAPCRRPVRRPRSAGWIPWSGPHAATPNRRGRVRPIARRDQCLRAGCSAPAQPDWRPGRSARPGRRPFPAPAWSPGPGPRPGARRGPAGWTGPPGPAGSGRRPPAAEGRAPSFPIPVRRRTRMRGPRPTGRRPGLRSDRRWLRRWAPPPCLYACWTSWPGVKRA